MGPNTLLSALFALGCLTASGAHAQAERPQDRRPTQWGWKVETARSGIVIDDTDLRRQKERTREANVIRLRAMEERSIAGSANRSLSPYTGRIQSTSAGRP